MRAEFGMNLVWKRLSQTASTLSARRYLYLKRTLVPTFWQNISRRTNAVSPSHIPEAGNFHGCALNCYIFFSKVKVKWDAETKGETMPLRYTWNSPARGQGSPCFCAKPAPGFWGTWTLTPGKNLLQVFPVCGQPMPPNLLSRALAMGSFSCGL